jgi:hypothetical protein
MKAATTSEPVYWRDHESFPSTPAFSLTQMELLCCCVRFKYLPSETARTHVVGFIKETYFLIKTIKATATSEPVYWRDHVSSPSTAPFSLTQMELVLCCCVCFKYLPFETARTHVVGFIKETYFLIKTMKAAATSEPVYWRDHVSSPSTPHFSLTQMELLCCCVRFKYLPFEMA